MQNKNSTIFTNNKDILGNNNSIGLFGKSLDEIKSKIYDIQSLGLKQAIFDTSKIDISAIKKYNSEIQKGTSYQEAMALASKNTNKETIALMESAKGATVTNKELITAQKASTLAAKAQSMAYKAVAVAANMIITVLVVKGIELAANAIDHYVNRAKYAAEAMEEAQQKIDDAQNTLQDMSSTISENKDRFLELSKGVDKFSNNLSLSKDDYEEYLNISNKFAELSPSLVSGYDDQGNALLNIGDSAEETSKKLDTIIEKQKTIAEQTLIDNMDDVANGIYYEVDEAKDSISELQDELETLQQRYEESNINLKTSNGLITFGDENYSKYGKELEKALTSAGIEFEKIAGLYDTSIQLKTASPEQLEKAQSFYDAWLETENEYYHASENGLKQDIESKEKSIEDSYSKMTANLQAWVKDNYNYQYLSDDSSAIVDKLIPEIDWNSLEEPPVTAYDYQNYVEENILKPLMEVPSEHKQKIDDMFNKLLSFEDGDLDILSFAKQLEEKLNEYGIKIDITPIIANEQEAKDKLQASIESISECGSADFTTSSGKRVDANDYKKLSEYTKDFNSEQIELWNKVTLNAKTAEEAISAYETAIKDSSEDSFEIPDAETLKQQISDLNSAIDSIQSAYDTLNSAIEEYNTNGGTLSIDTIQSLLSLSDEYLACLQVENGQLSLNADAMAQLAQAKLDDAQATAVTQAMTELQTIANGEAAQSTTNYITGNAALMSSLAQLSGSYEGVAKAAMTAAQAQRMSALISDAAGKDKTATENVMKGLDTKLKLIQTTKASINAGNFGKVAGKSSSSSKGSGSGKSASDTAKEEIEAYMEYLEKALEGGRITYGDYVRDVTLKLDDMYHNGRITAKEYFDYVEKRLNQQLEVYKSVLSAVTDLLEDEAQKWQDKIDALNDENDLLEKQKDDYDSILSAVDQVYQDEIDRLNEQKDLLQDKIDAINDENDALELQRKKQEALIALDKARQQRNVKIYTEGRGYFYDIDQDAYKDAQQNLQDIKNEEVIKKLEDEQDALDDSIELLEKYRDLWNDIADAYKKKTNEALAVALWGENYEKLILQNRTQDIEAFKDKYLEIQSKIDDNKSLIDSYQEKVDYYNKLKEQWSDISSAYEKEQQRMYAAQILGANWEKDVLDGRLDVLSQFRDQYLEIQRQMTQAALDGARARNDAAASGGTGGSGGSSGGGGGSTPIQNQQAYHVLHLVGGYSTSGEASSKISSFNGKGVYKYKDGKWYVYKEEDYSNLSFGSKSEADDYIKKHLSPAGRFLVKYYHNGLENGLVDFNKKDSNFDLVQKYGLKKYEVPAILKQGEAVMNQEQIKNLGEALRSIPTAATLYKTPDYTKMMSSLKTNNTPVMVTQSVNITLPNVTNNSGYENLTRELNRLKLDAYQFANRRN